MKKIAGLVLGGAICLQVTAQNSKVTSAKMHLDSYESQQDTSELTMAKQSIDEASVNEKTKDEPKTYLYRGEVYMAYFTQKLGMLVSKAIKVSGAKNAMQARAEAYTNIDTNTICVAANSFMKVIQMVPNDYYAEEAKQPQNLPTCLIHLENMAVRAYSVEHYSTALALYKKILQVDGVLNRTTDSAYKQTIEYAAVSAEAANNMPQAVAYYQQLIDYKYDGATPYRSLVNIYIKQNDSAKAWNYMEKGRALYPNDLSMIITETNFYLTRHEYDKALNNLNSAITQVAASPDKSKQHMELLTSLYQNLGGLYDRKANPKDAKGNDLPKLADYDSAFAQADTNYGKALAISPDNFEVLKARGALYFNRAVPIIKEANALPINATDKYNKLIAQAKVYFLRAEPYLERAYKIKPGDVENANALRNVYATTDQNDKLKAMPK